MVAEAAVCGEDTGLDRRARRQAREQTPRRRGTKEQACFRNGSCSTWEPHRKAEGKGAAGYEAGRAQVLGCH